MIAVASFLFAPSSCAPSGAEDVSADIAALSARMDELEAQHEADVADLSAAHEADIAALRAEHDADVDALNARIDALETALAEAAAEQEAATSTLEDELAAVEDELAAISEATTLPESVVRLAEVVTVDSSGDVVFEGVNVWIRSGEGTTDATPNGKGNLLLGYGESDGTEARTGSHSLIIGPLNDWTAPYGLIVGSEHAISGAGSAIIGSVGASVSGTGSVVVGGSGGSVTHVYSVVVGGVGLTSAWDCGARLGFVSSGSGC
jgi:hypothetical protein